MTDKTEVDVHFTALSFDNISCTASQLTEEKKKKDLGHDLHLYSSDALQIQLIISYKFLIFSFSQNLTRLSPASVKYLPWKEPLANSAYTESIPKLIKRVSKIFLVPINIQFLLGFHLSLFLELKKYNLEKFIKSAQVHKCYLITTHFYCLFTKPIRTI